MNLKTVGYAKDAMPQPVLGQFAIKERISHIGGVLKVKEKTERKSRKGQRNKVEAIFAQQSPHIFKTYHRDTETLRKTSSKTWPEADFHEDSKGPRHAKCKILA